MIALESATESVVYPLNEGDITGAMVSNPTMQNDQVGIADFIGMQNNDLIANGKLNQKLYIQISNLYIQIANWCIFYYI